MEAINDWWCRTFHKGSGRDSNMGICWLCGRSSSTEMSPKDQNDENNIKYMVKSIQSSMN